MVASLINLSPAVLKANMDAGKILLIDVREAHEFEAERIPGSINIPLSVLGETPLPDAAGKSVVLSCAAGVRSVTAANLCQARGDNAGQHLAGGLNAWKAAGLPTER